jgi:hypothetical protein
MHSIVDFYHNSEQHLVSQQLQPFVNFLVPEFKQNLSEFAEYHS